MKKKHYLLRHGRTLFLMLALLMASAAVGAFASMNETTSGQTLSAPGVWSWYDEGAWQVGFQTQQTVGGEEVAVTVHYKLNDGAYQTYTSDSQVAVAVGATLRFYASAEGYLDSPVTTITTTTPFWNSMRELWWDDFYAETEQTVQIHDDEPVSGFHYMMVDSLLSQHVLTPNVNTGNGFRLTSNGLYSEVERTYAIAGLKAGQVLILDIAEPDKIEAPEARARGNAGGSASRRRIIANGVTPKVTLVKGLELDQWNSEDNGQDAWHMYALSVTASGTVQFRVAGKCSLRLVSLMSVAPPQEPTFQLTGMSGASRTYRIYNSGSTLHYTTAVASAMPAVGSAAYSSTTSGYVDVTVSGQGYLYAYSENSAGNGAVASQYVNGVVLTLNAPVIDGKSYDASTGLWTVTLSADQTNIDGRPTAAIYYRIGDGAATLYSEAFTIADGATLSIWAKADGYGDSPVVTMKAEQQSAFDYVWSEYYSYYSAAVVTKGTEVETGLFQILYNGNPIGNGYLLTPDENFNDNFMVVRYNRGLTSAEPRTYAYSGLTEGQMLTITYSNGTITPVKGLQTDAWNSTALEAHLRVTASGTVRFTLSGGAYLLYTTLYNERQDGDVTVADANGNRLTYHYENATSDATLTSISSYADDETKAGHIIIADQVTDRKGNVHKVTAVGSLSNKSDLKSVVFGKHITSVGRSAFYYCQQLEKVTLNSSLDSIASSAFSYCTALTDINLAAATTLRAIPEQCFYSCTALETLTLPNSVKTIGRNAFYGCSGLRTMTFGADLPEGALGTDTYTFYNVGNLESMTLPGINIPFAANYYSLPASLILYVNADMVDAYKANDYTKKFHIMAIGTTSGYQVTTTAGGQIATELAKKTDNTADVLELTVSGPINGTDINYLHQAMPYLQTLNLKAARIVEGGDQYARWNVNGSTVTQYSTSSSYLYSTKNDSVGPYMFSNMPQLKSLVLPDGVTGIGANAVYGSNKISTLGLPAALKTIGDNALRMSTSSNQLAQIDIPASVTTIGKGAFYYAAITAINIPSGVTRIEDNTFYYCQNLKTAVLPDGITTIGGSAFYNCTSLESVNLPAQVQTIGDYAFYYCYQLASPVVIPAACQSIGSYAFFQCENLPSVTFSEGLNTIGNSAFYYCHKLPAVSLPATVTSLGSSAFSNIDSLRTFVFPEAIKQVPDYILQYCYNLESVTLAPGTTRIGSQAFSNCRKLTTIDLSQPTLTAIGYEAFYQTGLTSVALTDQVTSLGNYVFANCQQLESINVPTPVTAVPNGFCQYCPSLTRVTMHDGIRSIGSSSFSECTSLETISLNDNITEIGSQAFYDCRKLSLTQLPSALEHIRSSAFYYTKDITALTLPTGLKSLEDYAFQSSGLRSIVIPQGITRFGNAVFYECDSLTRVTLPADMKTLPSSTFYGTTSLKTIQLPAGLETIDYSAFYGSGLTAIEFPASLKTIGQQAFYGSQITEITIPKTVTSVGSRFAAYCPNLKRAALGRKMDYTKNSYFDYFSNCSSLDTLRIYAGTPPGISTNYYSNYTSAYRANCVLEVPMDVVDTYKATDGWNTFKEIVGFEVGDELRDADFAVMKKLYQRLDGAHWAKPWNLTSNTHSAGKWQGVTTRATEEDEEVYAITAIDLSGQGLTGALPKEVFLMDSLVSLNLSHNAIEAQVDTLLDSQNTRITTLNLEGNHLRGDLYPFVKNLPSLTSLNVAYNWLTAYSQKTDNTLLTNRNLSRGYQFVDYATRQPSVPEDLMEQVVIDFTPGTPVTIESNTLQTYRHESGDYGFTFSSLSRLYDDNGYYTTSSTELTKSGDQWIVYTGNLFRAPKNQLVAYTHQNPWWSYITYIFRVDWRDGDVNGDQTVDVSDLQNVIYYALNDRRPNSNELYNYSAADANSDNKINVSDIVGAVDHLMAFSDGQAAARAQINNVDCRNTLMLRAGSAVLANADEVAALQMTISGAQQHQISVTQELTSRFTVDIRNVDGGVKVVVYSLVGDVLAPGEHQLLCALPAGAIVTDVRLVDSEAHPLGIAISGAATAIDSMALPSLQGGQVYDLQGRRVGAWDTLPSGVYIVNVNGKQYKVKK